MDQFKLIEVPSLWLLLQMNILFICYWKVLHAGRILNNLLPNSTAGSYPFLANIEISKMSRLGTLMLMTNFINFKMFELTNAGPETQYCTSQFVLIQL